MEESPKQPDEQAPSADDGAIDQASIDAMFGGSTEDAAPPAEAPAEPPAEPPADASSEISQADIDALMGGAAGGEPATDAPTPEPEPSDERLDTLGRPFDEAAAAMQAAMDEEAAAAAAAAPSPGPPPPTKPFDLPDLGQPSDLGIEPSRVTMLNDVNLRVKIELGRTRMLVEDVLALGEGSVVELNKIAGDPVDVYVNERLIARGEVLVLNDNFCVRVSEVLSHDPHRVSA